jgi:hypothetical protein
MSEYIPNTKAMKLFKIMILLFLRELILPRKKPAISIEPIPKSRLKIIIVKKTFLKRIYRADLSAFLY